MPVRHLEFPTVTVLVFASGVSTTIPRQVLPVAVPDMSALAFVTAGTVQPRLSPNHTLERVSASLFIRSLDVVGSGHSSVSALADFRALTAFRALSLARSIADRTSGVSAPSWNALIVFECSMYARRFARRLGASNGVFISSWNAAVPQTGQPGLPQSPSPSVSFGHATLFRNRLSTASRASWSVSRRFGSLV